VRKEEQSKKETKAKAEEKKDNSRRIKKKD
jgi:hypothetical protein